MIIVVGGSGLIGSKTLGALVADGYDVVNVDIRDISDKSVSKDRRYTYIYHDCNLLENVEDILHNISLMEKPVRGFVNCSYPRSDDFGKCSFNDLTIEKIKSNLTLQLGSAIWWARCVAEMMKVHGQGGSIVSLGSIYGIVAQDVSIYRGTEMHENAIYGAMRGGLVPFTKQLASIYSRFNIRANIVCPGGLVGHVAGKLDAQPLEFISNYSERCPSGRLGKAEEIANVITFLLSSKSSYMSGSVLMADGGWSAI